MIRLRFCWVRERTQQKIGFITEGGRSISKENRNARQKKHCCSTKNGCVSIGHLLREPKKKDEGVLRGEQKKKTF